MILGCVLILLGTTVANDLLKVFIDKDVSRLQRLLFSYLPNQSYRYTNI